MVNVAGPLLCPCLGSLVVVWVWSKSCFPHSSTWFTTTLCSLLWNSSVLTSYLSHQNVLSLLRPPWLSWPCYAGCLFVSMEDLCWGKIMYVAQERTELTSPPDSQTTQLWFSEATWYLFLTFLHFLLAEQTSIVKKPSTSELGSVLSKLSTAGRASKALLTSPL